MSHFNKPTYTVRRTRKKEIVFYSYGKLEVGVDEGQAVVVTVR